MFYQCYTAGGFASRERDAGSYYAAPELVIHNIIVSLALKDAVLDPAKVIN